MYNLSTKCNNYCMQNNISHIQPKISESQDCFTHLYNSGASYSVLNSSKSVFSHFVFLPPYSSILEHSQILKHFKCIYSLRPPTQKKAFTWDVKILLDYFSHKGETDQLSDRKLYTKTFDFAFIAGRPKNEHCFSVEKNDNYRYRGYISTKSCS